MNLLDENVRADQRALLHQWRIPFRQVGKEISRRGVQDENILVLLHRLKRPTFFTQDEDFFKSRLCHASYCLVWLDVSDIEVARYIRRFLHQSEFRTHGQRLGTVIHASVERLRYWQTGTVHCLSLNWSKD
jgi:hypothetical protein